MKTKKIKEEELKQHELVIGRVGDGMRANPKKTNCHKEQNFFNGNGMSSFLNRGLIKKLETNPEKYESVIDRGGSYGRVIEKANKKLKEVFAIALCMAMMNITTLYAASDPISKKIEKWTTWLSGTLGPAVLIIGVAIMGLSSIGKDDSRDLMAKGKNIAIAGICVTLAKSIIGFLF